MNADITAVEKRMSMSHLSAPPHDPVGQLYNVVKLAMVSVLPIRGPTQVGLLRTAGVTSNYLRGLAAEARFRALLKSAGFDVVGRHITVLTPHGKRVTDIVIRVNNKFYGIEVKSGQAAVKWLQGLKDKWINLRGGQGQLAQTRQKVV